MQLPSTLRAAVVGMSLLYGLPVFAQAQTYRRDPTFGTDGRVVMDFGNPTPNYTAGAALVLPNDQILVAVLDGADNLRVVRLLPDGALDTSFGTGGVVTLAAVPASFSTASSGGLRAPQVEVLPDGSVVRSGLSGGRYALLRYLPSGAIDTGFGTAGVAVPNDINSYNRFIVQPDGKIVLIGATPATTSAPDYYMVVKRLSATGTTEFTTIVPQATVPSTTNIINVTGYSVLLQPDGKILAVGTGNTRTSPSANNIFTVARLLSDGNLDGSYGTNGRTDIINLPNTTVFPYRDAVLQTDGKLVIAAQYASVDLVRLTTAGALDPTFGTQGQVRINSANGNVPGTGSGPVLAAPNNGVYVTFSATALTASRLNAAGQLDASFMPASYPSSYMTEYFSSNAAGQSLLAFVRQQSNDRLLFIGTSATGLFPAPGPARRSLGLLRMSAQPLAAASPQLSAQVTVFPNPTRRQLWLSRPADAQPAEVTLSNVLGQQVLRRQVPASPGPAAQAVALPELTAGVYTLRVALPGGLVTKRIVIE